MNKFVMTIFGASGDLTKRKLMPGIVFVVCSQASSGRI